MSTTNWTLPKDLLEQSVRAMRPYGNRGHEGLGLWFGRESAGTVEVTHLIVPYGAGLVTHPLQLRLSPKAMSRLTRLSAELDRYWCGQIHSHPGNFTALSDVDKEFGIQVQDYLSVVCPHYAQVPLADLSEFGVHVFDHGAYRTLGASEARKRVTTKSDAVQVINIEVQA